MRIELKSPQQIADMREGGAKLARVRKALALAVKPGATAMDVENLAVKLIEEEGAEASFKFVPNYKWATCVNVNDGVVHGIPKEETVFKTGDTVSVDVGVFYKGFHTDAATTVYLGSDPLVKKFIEHTKAALNAGLENAKAGRQIGDISRAIGDTLAKHGINPVWNLTGHGVGRNLHEDPRIPNFYSGSNDEKQKIVVGMTLAVEVMATLGNGEMKLAKDGWTLRTKDGTIAALFEESIAITDRGTLLLTKDA